MKNYWKAGILTLTLVLPALLLVFMHLTAENQYKLPRFFPRTETSGKVLLAERDTLFEALPVKNEISVANLFTKDSIVSKKVDSQKVYLQKEFPEITWITHSSETEKLEKLAFDYMKSEAVRTGKQERFSENGKLFLIDRHGVARGIFNGLNSEEIDRLSAEIKVLKAIQKNEK